MVDFYNNFRTACASRGKNITGVLRDLGRSDGSTGTWKAGKYPRLDTVMQMAEYLHISLDELCYGAEGMKAKILSDNDREWLAIVSRIPPDRQELCKAFLRTHIATPTTPEKYLDKRNA